MPPIEINAQVDPVGCDADPSGRRTSLKGFLSVPMAKYLEGKTDSQKETRQGPQSLGTDSFPDRLGRKFVV